MRTFYDARTGAEVDAPGHFAPTPAYPALWCNTYDFPRVAGHKLTARHIIRDAGYPPNRLDCVNENGATTFVIPVQRFDTEAQLLNFNHRS